jgi:hypothetical protein
MSKPVIQVTNTTPFTQETRNLALEGNKQRPLTSYVEVWEGVLTPRGGVEALLLEGILYTATIAFTVSMGGYLLIASTLFVITYTIGGMVAVVLERRLTAPWYMRCGLIAVGYLLALL